MELAFDAILKEKMKERNKLGFRPPRARGARGGLLGGGGGRAPRKARRAFSATRFGAAFLDRFGAYIDPTASVITLINDGTIFAVFGLWAAWQVRERREKREERRERRREERLPCPPLSLTIPFLSPSPSPRTRQRDPTFPLLSTICYAAWKLYDKRKKASPDGPFVGGSPVFGAAAGTALALLLGLAASVGVAKVVPALPGVRPAAVGLFALNLVVGLVSIYLR